MRTPIRDGEPETTPFTLPAGVSPAPRNVIVHSDDFEIPKPGAVTIVGSLATWVCVACLVGSFFWIF